MSSLDRQSIIIFVACLATRLTYYTLTGFTADDAFITFRYAENIAYGYGFVYNEGQQVLGTSTPLFTLILSFLAACSVNVWSGAFVISLLSSALTAVVIFRFGHALRFTQTTILPVYLYLLWPRSLTADTCGMETALFTLLVTSCFYCHHKRKYFYAVALATLATLTRPEGAWLLLLILAMSLNKDRFNWKVYIGIPVSLLLPWAVFSLTYFGALTPNSVSGKLALYSQFGTNGFFGHVSYLLALHNPGGWLLLLMVIGGLWWLVKRQNCGQLETVWLMGMLLFFAIAPTHLFFWYVAPIYPVFLLLVGASFNWARDFLPRKYAGYVAIAVIVLATPPLLWQGYRQVAYFRNFQDHLARLNREVGLYMYKAADRERDWLAAEDIGYIGYFSEMKILDRDGLVSPEAGPYNSRGDYLGFLLDLQPRWVGAVTESPTSPFIDDSLFLAHYRLEQSFKFEDSAAYNVYQLIAGDTATGE